MKMKDFAHFPSLIVLVVILVTSCEVTRSDEFVIQNDSSYDLKIEAYDCVGIDQPNDTLKRNEDLKKEEIEIGRGRSYKVEHENRGYLYAQPNYSPFAEAEVDSIVIVFNNERILIQSCNTSIRLSDCDVERNMADYENEYTREKRNRKEYRYTYTITNEDYDRAVAIGAN
jgi:hypothetical protein